MLYIADNYVAIATIFLTCYIDILAIFLENYMCKKVQGVFYGGFECIIRCFESYSTILRA